MTTRTWNKLSIPIELATDAVTYKGAGDTVNVTEEVIDLILE